MEKKDCTVVRDYLMFRVKECDNSSKTCSNEKVHESTH